jgi:pimeloyl-ACP methyl ester carboxylesterase
VRLEPEVLVDGKRLEVVTHEPAAPLEPPILMLHEGLGSVSLWKSFPALLAARTNRRVIAYSRYGHGESDVLAGSRDVDYLHREGEIGLPQLIAALGLERPILLGHSDGASIALICAGAHPELVSALVLEAPHVFVEDETIRGIEAARTAYAHTDLPQRLGRHHRDGDRTFWGWNDIWLDPRFRRWNIMSYVSKVRCPILLIQGAGDEYGTVAQLDAIAAAVADAQVVLLEECGHAPHRDQSAPTLEAIGAFVGRADVLTAPNPQPC